VLVVAMPERSDSDHWMVMEGGAEPHEAGRPPFTSRFASIGVQLPDSRLTTDELMARMRHKADIDLEGLTGIHERRVAGHGEDSFTLALGAARDCLERSGRRPEDVEVLINASITKYTGGLSHRFEPPLSLSLKGALGAHRALNFDLSNACAGMMTGVFILNDFIRRGDIECGMVVSGEYISELGASATRQVRSVLSDQMASLTLGDAGAAVIVERAPEGAPSIDVAGFTTLSEHSRLCLGFPSRSGPGGTMYTDARAIHKVALEDSPPLLREALRQGGLDFNQIDYLIPHQTSARAIEKGMKNLAKGRGGPPKHVVANVEQYGNTASTTHFVALYRYLQEGRFDKGDKVMLLSFASGLEVGVVIFPVDAELMDRYGHDD
jgi:3-oxoacyl-[acyl-carrier-protein] synthase III